MDLRNYSFAPCSDNNIFKSATARHNKALVSIRYFVGDSRNIHPKAVGRNLTEPQFLKNVKKITFYQTLNCAYCNSVLCHASCFVHCSFVQAVSRISVMFQCHQCHHSSMVHIIMVHMAQFTLSCMHKLVHKIHNLHYQLSKCYIQI